MDIPDARVEEFRETTRQLAVVHAQRCLDAAKKVCSSCETTVDTAAQAATMVLTCLKDIKLTTMAAAAPEVITTNTQEPSKAAPEVITTNTDAKALSEFYPRRCSVPIGMGRMEFDELGVSLDVILRCVATLKVEFPELANKHALRAAVDTTSQKGDQPFEAMRDTKTRAPKWHTAYFGIGSICFVDLGLTVDALNKCVATLKEKIPELPATMSAAAAPARPDTIQSPAMHETPAPSKVAASTAMSSPDSTTAFDGGKAPVHKASAPAAQPATQNKTEPTTAANDMSRGFATPNPGVGTYGTGLGTGIITFRGSADLPWDAIRHNALVLRAILPELELATRKASNTTEQCEFAEPLASWVYQMSAGPMSVTFSNVGVSRPTLRACAAALEKLLDARIEASVTTADTQEPSQAAPTAPVAKPTPPSTQDNEAAAAAVAAKTEVVDPSAAELREYWPGSYSMLIGSGRIEFDRTQLSVSTLRQCVATLEAEFPELAAGVAVPPTSDNHRMSLLHGKLTVMPVAHTTQLRVGSISFINLGVPREVIDKCMATLIEKFPEFIRPIPPRASTTQSSQPPSAPNAQGSPDSTTAFDGGKAPAVKDPEPETSESTSRHFHLHLRCYAWAYIRPALEALIDAARGKLGLQDLANSFLTTLAQVSNGDIRSLRWDVEVACRAPSARAQWNGICWAFNKHAAAIASSNNAKPSDLDVLVVFIAVLIRPIITEDNPIVLWGTLQVCTTTLAMNTPTSASERATSCPLLVSNREDDDDDEVSS